MIGRNHLIVGTCSAMCVGMGVDAVAHTDGGLVGTYLKPLALHVESELSTFYGLPPVAAVFVGMALFWFGTLLPDIDSDKSMLGRYFHLPVEHRTWTHAIWFVLMLGALSWFVPIFWWLTAGYFVHLFWDSLSRGGVCWFYPFSHYMRFSSGAKVKRGHTWKLYGVGDVSETFVVAVVVGLTFFCGYWYAKTVLGWPLPSPLIL